MTTPIIHRGKGRWTMNITYLDEPPFHDILKETWEKWKTHIPRFPDIVQWWDRYAKSVLKLLFIREGSERNRDRAEMEHFYYAVVYDALQGDDQQTTKTILMRKLKAKIVRLKSTHSSRLSVDTGQDRLQAKSRHHITHSKHGNDKLSG